MERELELARAQIAKQEETIETLKAEFEITKGYRPNAKALDKLAVRILREASSRYSKESLVSDLRGLFDYIGDKKAFDGAEVMARASAVARNVLNESRELDDSAYNSFTDAREYFKKAPSGLSETQMDEAKCSRMKENGAARRY